MKEVWKVIANYPSYSISNLGRVRRDKPAPGCKVGHILTPHTTNKGYFRVRLSLGSRADFVRPSIHSLIAEAFIGARPKGYDINHKDGNRKNNAISNLEYVTRSENCKDGFRRGRVAIPPKFSGENHPNAKITATIASSIKKLLNKGVSDGKVADSLKVSIHIVRDIKRGKTWKGVFNV